MRTNNTHEEPGLEKKKLIEILKTLLDIDRDVSFLEKLEKEEIETLIAHVRAKMILPEEQQRGRR